MKHGSWLLFVCGVFGVFSVGSLLHVRSAAGEEDPKPSVKPLVPLVPQFDAALEKKKKEIEESERRLKEREDRLAVEEARLRSKIDELVEVQGQIEAFRAEREKLEEAQFAKLVKSLETMQAKKAAAVISAMEDILAVSVLRKMKEKKIASVLDVMEPSRAVALSALIADRKPASATDNKEQAPAKGGPVRP